MYEFRDRDFPKPKPLPFAYKLGFAFGAFFTATIFIVVVSVLWHFVSKF